MKIDSVHLTLYLIFSYQFLYIFKLLHRVVKIKIIKYYKFSFVTNESHDKEFESVFVPSGFLSTQFERTSGTRHSLDVFV